MRLIDADAFDERVRVAGGMSEEELTEDFKDGVQAVLYLLSKQPTIQSEPQWIPITQKLPDLDKCVLATTSWGTITIAERWKDTKGEENWFVSEGECNAERDDIVAWKPLPEPYKGEEHG